MNRIECLEYTVLRSSASLKHQKERPPRSCGFLLMCTRHCPSLRSLPSTPMLTFHDYFADPIADTYVCSSDGVAFKVHKIILSLASDYFRELFSSQQQGPLPIVSAVCLQLADLLPERTELDGVPAYHLPESSGVLDPLFRLCYPVDDPPLETLDEVRWTLGAAKKYQMREALKMMKRQLLTFVATEPMRVYAIACQFGLEDVADQAASEVLRQDAQNTYVKELEGIPAARYSRFISKEAHDAPRSSRLAARTRDRLSLPTPPLSDCDHPSRRNAKSLSVYDSGQGMLAFTLRTAPHPFNARDAEVVLSTSDNMQFRVYKSVIELASPVLASKLAGVPPSSERRFSLPNPVRKLTVPESSQVVSALLSILYPTDERLPTDLHTLYLALIAARDYQIQKAICVLQHTLTARKNDKSVAPELLYAIACRCNLHELASAAAKRTLRTSILTDSTIALFDKYRLSAAAVQRLIVYHHRCRDAALYVAGKKWRMQLESSCRLGRWARDGEVPCWYECYMSGIAEDEWPTAKTATNPELLRNALAGCRDAGGAADGKGCRYCSDRAHLLVFYEFTRYVGETIEGRVDHVVLDWPSDE
ncbi:hypothetical protein C8Q74DRAFT_1247801 [Fomes fomentarius]|nr:hypothetical protein C8Q74DRAFT_1247801 [Fomes fomentarius]